MSKRRIESARQLLRVSPDRVRLAEESVAGCVIARPHAATGDECVQEDEQDAGGRVEERRRDHHHDQRHAGDRRADPAHRSRDDGEGGTGEHDDQIAQTGEVMPRF